MSGLNVLYISALLIIVLITITTVALYYFLFIIPENLQCEFFDEKCIERSEILRDTCTPSTSILTLGDEENYTKIRVTISWKDGKCVMEEEVIEDYNSGIAMMNLTGYKNECELTTEELQLFGPHACQGSILDYAMLGDGGEEGFGSGTPDSTPPYQFCSMSDITCKTLIENNVENCVPSLFENIEFVSYEEDEAMYWTLYLDIDTQASGCVLYYKIINAINLPPEIPFEVIGTDMNCWFPPSELPIEVFNLGACTGDLKEYFRFLFQDS